MKKAGFIFGLVTLFVLSSAMAGITLSEPLEVYNLGDRLYISADGILGADSGNFNIDLVCENQKTNLVKLSARSFDTEEPQAYSIPYKILSTSDLEVENLTGILGDCQVVASLATNVVSTKSFIISDSVSVKASLDKEKYNPGEGITITVDAVKENGVPLNGFIEGSNISDFSRVIEEGHAVETFSTSETIEAGNYILGVVAYDNHGNRGTSSVFVNIRQVPTSIILSLSEEEVVPGKNFSIGAEVFDQSGSEMGGIVTLRMISQQFEEIERTIPAGEVSQIEFPFNATVGIWTIEASFGDLLETRDVEMLGVQKATFEIEDDVLIVKNIGNVVYNKSIEVSVGEEVRVLDLNMELGAIRKFSLEAPSGEYGVVVNDGEDSFSQNVLLTGSAVSIKDLKEVGFFKSYSIVWIFLILVLGGIGIVFFVRYRKTRRLKERGLMGKKVDGVKGRIGLGRKKDSREIQSSAGRNPDFAGGPQNVGRSDRGKDNKKLVDLTGGKIGTAESTLVLKGEKNPSVVIALSIKNYSDLVDNARKSLVDSIENIKEMKGLVDWRGDYIFVVFSPLVTKTFKNELLAVRAGNSILKSLSEHNKKFKDKIEFNMGIHAGELIASKEGGKLKYTSIGNTISLAKRISDSESGKLLVSEEVRKKMMRDLKVVKVGEVGKNPIYAVSEIKNREANEAKLKDLLKRM